MNQSGFRDTVLRQSYVFNTGKGPSILGTNSNVNRSFISTAIVNDSLAYGDDLRKYLFRNSDHAYRIYLTTRRLI